MEPHPCWWKYLHRLRAVFIVALLDFLLFGSSTVSCKNIDFSVAASFTPPAPYFITEKNI